ncbi:MAG: hypothetical protein ABSG65_29175 [Bryobacteraceae bacterium]|jgi:hypothetical protein
MTTWIFTSWDMVFAGGTVAHDFISSSATAPPGAAGVEIPGYFAFPGQVEELFFAEQRGFDPYVDFYLGSLLTDAGGAIPLVGAFSCDGTCHELNPDDSNTSVGTPSAVPEPSTIVLTVLFLVFCRLPFAARFGPEGPRSTLGGVGRERRQQPV